MGSDCLTDTEFQFCKTKKFQKWTVMMVAQECKRSYCYRKWLNWDIPRNVHFTTYTKDSLDQGTLARVTHEPQ